MPRLCPPASLASAALPQIHGIGGVRPDAFRSHPDGLALDVMVPTPAQTRRNEIGAYALKNAALFGLRDSMWRGVYDTPTYPTGSEAYYR